jgi:hypothetical protein
MRCDGRARVLAAGLAAAVVLLAGCGAPTGDILVHEIRAANLPEAERLGFMGVAAIAGAGHGYTLVDCATRQPLH